MANMFDNTRAKMWYEELSEDQKATTPVADALLIELKNEAKRCLDASVANYNIKNSKTNTNFQWMKTVMSKGAVSDKTAAYVVLIQDSPLHSLDTLTNLVGMVRVGKKKECIVVVEHLVELFLSTLLPPTRKLTPFRERPLNNLNNLSSGNAVTRKKYLSWWYFEDQLKETYATFIRNLNAVAHDTVDNNKEKALSAMYKLLAGNPEQEKNLLVNIINKLGDPSRKVASKAIYCLTQLLHQHSNMQSVVLSEIEKLLFRSNISSKAQYYGLCFLSQFYLCHETSDVARHLIDVYFSFFKACVKKGDVNSRMMSALLMGVNRAYPYAKLEKEKISSHINTMYRVVHVANFNVSFHALALLYQVSDHTDVSDRFYSALYKKLLDPQIASTTHQAMVLSLVYKALNKDTQTDRAKVIIKRLLQNAIYMQPTMACGILYIISHVLSKNSSLAALILKPTAFSAPTEQEIDEDNDDEKYTDVKDDDDEIRDHGDGQQEVLEHLAVPTDASDNKATKPGWVHDSNTKRNAMQALKNYYDGLCRNPLYSGGQFCAYTELEVLQKHFHPTVSLFAQNLLTGKTIQYTGDPLKDFSLIQFLDRFVFKNPKRQEDVANQGCHPTFGKRKKYVPRGVRRLAVNSSSYLNEKRHKIPVEELFLYTFLQRKTEGRERRGDDDEDNDESDLESVASEEFEDMLDKMTGASKEFEEDLDYMNDVGDKLKSKKGNNEDDVDDIGAGYDDDDNDDDDDDDDGEAYDKNEAESASDLDMNEEDNELIQFSDDGDDNESDLVFDSDDDDELSTKKKVKEDDIKSLFASADEFASLLEDEGGSNVAPGSSSAMSNKDRANLKQLAWEENRNRWMKGYGNVTKKSGKRFNKNFKPNNKRMLPKKANATNKKKRIK